MEIIVDSVIRTYPGMTFIYPVMGGLPDDVSEELVTQEKRKKGWRMNCDVGKATKGLENEL